MLYLNEPETDNDDTDFEDNFNVSLPPDEETEGNVPFSIELPTSVRATVISRLDNFFKHHKSVNASIFYPFDSSSLSIESIRQIDNIIRPNKLTCTCNVALTFELDKLTVLNSYEHTPRQTFKAGDRVVLQKNRGLGVFGSYGTIVCANNRNQKAVICLDTPIRPSFAITFTNYRMKNNFSNDCVVEFPYTVLKLVVPV